MANSDKNIIITPFVSGVTQPQMKFVGQGNDPIYLKVLDGITGTGATAGGALSIEGSAGQLFSIVNRLGTGSIFSVNDISGIPIIDANASGDISLAGYFGNVGVGLTAPTEKFQVTGNAFVSGLVTAVSGVSAAGGVTLAGTFSGTTGSFSRLLTASAGISAAGGVTLAGTLQGTTAAFTGLVSSTVGFSGSGTNLKNIVTTFNGLSGAVTGASLGANTFTALNTFNAGISASALTVAGGATFAGDIAVNGGDITTTSAYATLYNTNCSQVSIGSAATTVSLMGATANTQTNIGSQYYVKTGQTTTTTTAKQLIFSYSNFSGPNADTYFADIIITANYGNNVLGSFGSQITKMLVATSYSNAINHTEYGNVNTGGNLAVYTAEIVGSGVYIYATPTNGFTTVFNTYATLIKGTYGAGEE